MNDPIRSVSTRAIAAAAIALFVPVVISTVAVPQAAWVRNYPGILFHLMLFLLVSRLEAPEWARAAGYGWLILDVMAAVLTLNGIPFGIFQFIRLGGHLFGGIWIATASLSGSRPVMVVGVITGIYLSGFTFLSPFLPMKALAPTAFLTLIWLAIIAWQNGGRRATAARPSGDRTGSLAVSAGGQ